MIIEKNHENICHALISHVLIRPSVSLPKKFLSSIVIYIICKYTTCGTRSPFHKVHYILSILYFYRPTSPITRVCNTIRHKRNLTILQILPQQLLAQAYTNRSGWRTVNTCLTGITIASKKWALKNLSPVAFLFKITSFCPFSCRSPVAT